MAEARRPQEIPQESSALASLGLALSDWFERWFPDAFALALAAAVIVAAASILTGSSALETAQRFGAGFWDLATFTLQMSLIIVTGYAVATSPPVYAMIRALATLPTSGRGAVAFVGLFSMLASLVSWSFSLIFSALLAREVSHRVRAADYRAIGAAAYLGVGSVWALGLSSSAALIMASPASLPDAIEKISGVIPLGQTLGLWQSLVVAAAIILVSMVIAYFSAPPPAQARSMADMGVSYTPAVRDTSTRQTPGEWLEYSPLLTLIVCALGFGYLIREVATAGPSVILDLNHYLFLFLIVGLLLHWRPRSFVQAITASVTPVGGVLIQYPIYAGIVRVMTEGGLATTLAHFFVSISTQHTYPVMIGIYSAFLGLFIPSAGGKWLIEAPYMLDAAKSLQVHLGWVVQTYNATEALANLIHPFWMLPLVGILGLKARDIVGYSMLQFVVHVPLVLFLVWALNYTLTYVPPIVP
ncbi:MAG TPA: TIGR00366 family protein [Vicinamibacterales bacterium]|jgi:short-chain fatty acids transporter|nr:TIGR00366 family protein [Vicinamibacterales bacterium]